MIIFFIWDDEHTDNGMVTTILHYSLPVREKGGNAYEGH